MTSLMTLVGLFVAGAFLFIVLSALLFSGKRKPAASVGSVFHAPPAATYREQDKQVQTEMTAKWYAEMLDEEFKQKTLDDLSAKLAARK
jgi:hypothetical protein